MKMSNTIFPIVVVSKEVSDFITTTWNMEATNLNGENERWYWNTLYFKQVGENKFQMLTFKDSPDGLKIIVEQDLPTKENEDEQL